MEKKICSKCKIEKDVCEFYSNPKNKLDYRNSCKSCMKKTQQDYSKNNRDKRNLTQKIWRENNTDKIKEFTKKYYNNNPEKYKLISKIYRDNNPEKIKEFNKKYYNNNLEFNKKRVSDWVKQNYDRRISYIQNWKSENYEHIKEYKNYKYNNDPLYKLTHNIRNRVRDFLKLKNITKNNKTFDIVGCSPEFLKEHIEKQFTKGMSWELMGNYIHIDHIVPLSSANTEEEIYRLCHYTNLQPLWSKDNLKKSNKIIKS
jgi:hypothetical protein